MRDFLLILTALLLARSAVWRIGEWAEGHPLRLFDGTPDG